MLNNELDKYIKKIKDQGTQYIKPEIINYRIKNFNLSDKKDNINGLQISDLITNPIGRHIIGKDKEDFEIIKNKFRENKKNFRIRTSYFAKIKKGRYR